MSLSARHIYRGLHREARRVAAAAGRGSEAPDFVGLVREDFKSAVAGAGADEKAREKALFKASEMLVFLRSQRKYSELIDRYNPGANMTQAERNRLTARRVGLNMPKDNSDDYYKGGGGGGSGGKK